MLVALASLVAVPLLLWGSPRFHLPFSPLLAVLAGGALAAGVDRVRRAPVGTGAARRRAAAGEGGDDQRDGGEQPEPVQPLEAGRPAGVRERTFALDDPHDDEPITASSPMVTNPASRGRPRCTIRTAAATAARSAQPTPISSAAATTQTAAAIQRVRVGERTFAVGEAGGGHDGGRRPAPVERGEGEAAEDADRRDDQSDRCGPWAVHCITTSTGSSLGGIRQPLNPPSTSCGGPRSTPSAVADQHR